MPSSEPLQIGGPFSGILVVDLAHVFNGPFGTMILNDLGDYDDPPVRVGALGLD